MTGHRVRSSSRRAVLTGACAACAAALAGCARYGTSNGLAGPAAYGGAPSSAAGAGSSAGAASSAGPGSSAGTASSGTGASAVLASTADIPVGGGKVITDKRIVITQPQAGSFHAFTAICTHQGCIVNAVSGGTINCPCHGSRYSIVNGSVVQGPAPLPLAAVSIKVQGTSIVQV
jgi:Rieske Fe-S protein